MITIVDVETTGLIEPEGTDINLQPYLTEICAIKFDAKGKIVREINTLVKPPMPIPTHITKITGINDETVKNAPSFIKVYKELARVFFGSHTVVGHNVSFDMGLFIIELKRIGKEHQFPYPPIWFCTVEQSMHLKGYRLKNNELYKLATGKDIEGAHRARNDVLATYESYKWLVSNGRI